MTFDQAEHRSLVFKETDPTKFAYIDRLSDAEWDRLKGFNTDYLEGGIYASEILRALTANGVRLSRSQLNTRMQKWDVKRAHQQVQPDLLGRLADTWLHASNDNEVSISPLDTPRTSPSIVSQVVIPPTKILIRQHDLPVPNAEIQQFA
jgi:hypothetical protein